MENNSLYQVIIIWRVNCPNLLTEFRDKQSYEDVLSPTQEIQIHKWFHFTFNITHHCTLNHRITSFHYTSLIILPKVNSYLISLPTLVYVLYKLLINYISSFLYTHQLILDSTTLYIISPQLISKLISLQIYYLPSNITSLLNSIHIIPSYLLPQLT